MTKLFCPACGSALVKNADSREDSASSDSSEHWWCVNNECRVGGTYFKAHNPFKGVDSEPRQDYWSIDWIK